ncbi:MAG: N-6 DNA methylase [Clostridiales bacterium]|nr:N-6 DNA methylase [Clostridiales bacterium]
MTARDNLNFCIVKESLPEVNAAFSWCHQRIYRKDNISQSEAFSEFVKLVALKLMSDKEIKDKYPEALTEQKILVPAEDVRFSTAWIEREQKNAANPMSDIQFRAFVARMETEIALGERKRFFNAAERINLRPETIFGVVQKLEKMFLFGIDADLNGRLFETFLSATMRGKDLGQFFTPRSLIKMGVGLAQLKVHSRMDDGSYHTDTVVDACCGTGGFLIDVFADAWSRVEALTNLSRTEKDELKEKIRKSCIVGIDVGKGPNLSRVARLNMYLHGDGGTKIFNTDALDKNPQIDEAADDAEAIIEKKELGEIVADSVNYFDVAITNPPFSKVYERSLESENKILNQYVKYCFRQQEQTEHVRIGAT